MTTRPVTFTPPCMTKASYADELPQTALDYYRDVLLYRIYTTPRNTAPT